MWADVFKGIPQIFGDGLLRLLLGTNQHDVCIAEGSELDYTDISEADGVRNSRVMYVDSAGIMKFSYFCDSTGTTKTETMYLNAGTFYQIRNAYRAYTQYGTTGNQNACTAKVYSEDGSLKIGFKVRR